MLNQGFFHPRWATYHRPVVDGACTGRVLIERVIERGKWNPSTGLIDGEQVLQIYVGKARIQKTAHPVKRSLGEDVGLLQTVRLQLPMDGNEIAFPDPFEWQPNDRITILDAGTSHDMLGMKLYLWGWLGSTNSWQRTLVCQTNMKQQ